jgi:hypothetical protein
MLKACAVTPPRYRRATQACRCSVRHRKYLRWLCSMMRGAHHSVLLVQWNEGMERPLHADT